MGGRSAEPENTRPEAAAGAAGPLGAAARAGAYDALSALLVERAGFAAVYMTGFGVTASLIGRPDVGLLSMREMADAARRIVSVVDVPVIADADTGYGNAVNVVRTVRKYEAAGVAGLHLEDQVAPKRCGHLDGKQVIPAAAMADRLRAAVAAGATATRASSRTPINAVERLPGFGEYRRTH